MASTSPKFPLRSQLDYRPAQGANSLRDAPTCLIYSNHPLAFCSIKEAVCSDARLRFCVKPYSSEPKTLNIKAGQILVIDTCSVENWGRCLQKWRLERGLTIALISSETRTNELELQMLYLGAAGVLTFGDNLADHLPKAIHAVAQGNLWIRREILNLYIQRANSVLLNTSTPDQRFTNRERQIVELLQQKLSNRTIAQRLAISERTIKFHVSNILRKLNLANRRELRSLDASTAPFCPDWLLHQDADEATPLPYSPLPAPVLRKNNPHSFSTIAETNGMLDPIRDPNHKETVKGYNSSFETPSMNEGTQPK